MDVEIGVDGRATIAAGSLHLLTFFVFLCDGSSRIVDAFRLHEGDGDSSCLGSVCLGPALTAGRASARLLTRVVRLSMEDADLTPALDLGRPSDRSSSLLSGSLTCCSGSSPFVAEADAPAS